MRVSATAAVPAISLRSPTTAYKAVPLWRFAESRLRRRGCRCCRRHLRPHDPRGPIAETFGAETGFLPPLEERLELGDHVGVFHDVFIELVDARAALVAAEPELVTA